GRQPRCLKGPSATGFVEVCIRAVVDKARLPKRPRNRMTDIEWHWPAAGVGTVIALTWAEMYARRSAPPHARLGRNREGASAASACRRNTTGYGTSGIPRHGIRIHRTYPH